MLGRKTNFIGAVFASLCLTCEPALADGGWRACIYGPLGYTETIRMTHRLCYIQRGKLECINNASEDVIKTAPKVGNARYAGAAYFRSTLTEANIKKFDAENETGYFEIKIFSPRSGNESSVIKTKAVPFRRFAKEQIKGCDADDDERYHFGLEHGRLQLYDGCPPAVDYCR